VEIHSLKLVDWGLLDYGRSFELQKILVEKRIKKKIGDNLVLVEHPAAVTIGRSGGKNDLFLPEEKIRKKGIDLYYVDRGGRATYHGPGQLLIYPIIELKDRDLRKFVKKLLDTIAEVLKEYGIQPSLKNGNPGIWVNYKKIASIGIAVKKWVSYHGVALNVGPDLNGFKWIIPCGDPDEVMTSMELELNQPVNIVEVKNQFVQSFCEVFRYTVRKKALEF
jgi:lipoate-protein ligase B